MAGTPPYVIPPPPPPPPSSPSPTTHVTVIIVVVPIVGVICLGLLAALLFVLCRRRRCPDVEEEAKVDEVEDVEVKVTEHVRIVEGIVGEAGEVEAYKAGDAGCGCEEGGVVVEEAGAAVEAGIVVEDDVKVEEHVVRITEASKRERE